MRLYYYFPLASILCPDQTPAPVISFEKTHHDFGKTSHDQKISYRYKLTNNGNAQLQIKEIRPSCGCTYTLIGQSILKPGENTFIEVRFDPAGMQGNVYKYLDVISDDPANPNTRLTFEAIVTRDVVPSKTVIFFNNVSRNEKAASSIRLQSGNGQPVVLTGNKIQDVPYLSCTTQKDGLDVVLNVNFDGQLVPKHKPRGVETLTVNTSSKSDPVLQFHIQWNFAEAIVATPAKIAWTESTGKELIKTVHLRSISGKEFKVLAANSTSSLIKVVNISKSSAKEQSFDVVLSPKAKAGAYNEKLTLKLDCPEQQTVEITVVAVLIVSVGTDWEDLIFLFFPLAFFMIIN